ncbi:hypothetical protein F7725_014898 [Dissostichus mawsoni]|uniref:Uncharacterized protein n=1 Tax=Dissostichus mawsoni TaxID=36200 RepID=A0A7J5YHH4_DISMA|nr:hypothetical protein F7725_014898 [Dissostichus mawsoni]
MAQSAIDAFKDTQSLAKKESLQRLDLKDNSTFNTAGCLGEIQVGVIVIEVLAKTPVFSSDNVRHDIMSRVLSGDVKLQDVERNDKRRHKHTHYSTILRPFEDLLYSLRCRMKVNFDFLERFYIGMKDKRDQIVQQELFRCFRVYANLFCKTDSADLLKNQGMLNMLKLHEARQYLEMQKADSYSGILSYLSNQSSLKQWKRSPDSMHSF